MHNYPDIMSATTGLLVEVCSTLNKLKIEYVVVGGWTPYLLNTSEYNHPGTNDVDILVRDKDVSQILTDAVKGLLSEHYAPSAKHSFQLLKNLNVSSQELVFNVDLLHPQETDKNPEILVDLFDLGVKENELRDDTRFMKSIALPSSEVIFDGMTIDKTISHITPDGKSKTVTFKLMDYLGLLVSKSESVKGIKRPRDAFDIFLVFADKNVDSFLTNSKHLLSDRAAVRETLDKLKSYLEDDDTAFNANVHKYIWKYTPDAEFQESPSEIVLKGLTDIGV